MKCTFNYDHTAGGFVAFAKKKALPRNASRLCLCSLRDSPGITTKPKMPNYKKDKQLIYDLKFIKPYFEQLNIEKAVGLIDEEIRRAIKELPSTARKKYRNEDEQ
jgi:hypothetical protein